MHLLQSLATMSREIAQISIIMNTAPIATQASERVVLSIGQVTGQSTDQSIARIAVMTATVGMPSIGSSIQTSTIKESIAIIIAMTDATLIVTTTASMIANTMGVTTIRRERFLVGYC